MRYDRQIPLIGESGQTSLTKASVVIVGMGGLGSIVAPFLAGAGVGCLVLCDFDKVELSNLQRQVFYQEKDVGRLKVEAAKERLVALRNDIKVNIVSEKVSLENALDVVKGADVVVDGTDNLIARYAINDACYFSGIPLVYGSVFQYQGLVAVFSGSPCYRCLFPEITPSASCSEAGVLGVVPGTVALIQATEVLKLLLGKKTLSGLLKINAIDTSFKSTELPSDPACQLCSVNSKIKTMEDGLMVPTITVSQLKSKLEGQESFRLIDVRQPEEFEESKIDGAELIPLGELESGLGSISKSENIVLYCKVGGRSERALLLMQSLGYENVVHLEGGIMEWNEDSSSL